MHKTGSSLSFDTTLIYIINKEFDIVVFIIHFMFLVLLKKKYKNSQSSRALGSKKFMVNGIIYICFNFEKDDFSSVKIETTV